MDFNIQEDDKTLVIKSTNKLKSYSDGVYCKESRANEKI